MSEIVSQAATRVAPAAGTAVSVTTSSTTATNLSAFDGQIFVFQNASTAASLNRIHIRFGGSAVGAAVTTDVFLEPGQKEEFYLVPGLDYFRAISSLSTANLIYAVTG